MARSLNVRNDEIPSTSPLLNAFLLFAFGWLVLAAVTSGEAPATVAVQAP